MRTGRYARDTSVSVDGSKSEIERILARYGADQFMSGWDQEKAVIAFRMNHRHVKFILPLPARDDPAFTEYLRGSVRYARADGEAYKQWEQACRQRWRALALCIKAKLEAVEVGITTFEDEFLAHIVLPDGQRVGDWMKPQIEEAYLTAAMPPLLAAGR